MKNIDKAIEQVNTEIINQKALCCIVSERLMESSLIGTRDGYLKLAKAILETVKNYDEKIYNQELPSENVFWDDIIKKQFLMLPTHDAYIVGSYVTDNHKEMMDLLIELSNNSTDVKASVANDPDFQIDQLE